MTVLDQPDERLLALNPLAKHAVPNQNPAWDALGTRSESSIGWRVWGVWRDGEIMLRSPVKHVPWKSTSIVVECSRHDHSTPHPECREGVHCFTNELDAFTYAVILKGLSRLLIEQTGVSLEWTYVVGRVSTTGIVNHHFDHEILFNGAHKWVAQQVRIEKLFVSPNLVGMHIPTLTCALEDLYRIPVVVSGLDRGLEQAITAIQASGREGMRIARAAR
ncbi:hypothetical protein [Mycobacterium sp. 1482292.6]|uniref:hypothetical protein n=1 Tax=Mycobacterium sp. 1482292.6 TaxID=1834081 RepID=UPI0012E9D8C6|nr:hypothetical protein [Mycobacterium sp. 1482292.6]